MTAKVAATTAKVSLAAMRFLGAVDIAIELNEMAKRILRDGCLRGWGRVFEIPRLIYELRDGAMVPLGSPGLVSLNEVKARFLTGI